MRASGLDIDGIIQYPVEDSYSSRLVEHWDNLQEDCHYIPASQYLLTILDQYQLPRKIFELGCGTGVLAEYLLNSGIDVVAWDRSSAMRAKTANRCKCSPKLSWADPSDKDNINLHIGTFGAFVAQRIAPTESECQDIISLAHTLLAPGGVLLLSYWVPIAREDFSALDWPPVDIDVQPERVCLRFNEWNFRSGQKTDQWRFVCAFIEGSKLNFETGCFPLPQLSDEMVSYILDTNGFGVVSQASSEVLSMGVRVIARLPHEATSTPS